MWQFEFKWFTDKSYKIILKINDIKEHVNPPPQPANLIF